MSKFKKNKDQIHSEQNNMELLKKRVDDIMKESINHSPCDFICRKVGTSYPKTTHMVLEIPGQFKNIESTNGFKLNGKALYMDGVESVLFDDGETIKDYASCIEYLTTDINPKKEKLFDYNLSIVIQLKKYCYIIIVTPHKQNKNEEIYFIDGHPVHVLFRVFDKEKIYKILNTLSKKDYTNNKISEEDVVKFSFSIAFAKDNYAKDFLEKSVELFCSIEKIDTPQRIDLYTALKEKIKYHFGDDKNKKRELITMITKALTDPDFEQLSRFEQNEIILKDKDDAIHDRDETIKEMGNVISQKDNVISEKENVISEKDTVISQKDDEISKLRQELESLKNSS